MSVSIGLGFCILGLYLWVVILGGFSFWRGVKVLIGICIFGMIASLRREARWGSILKGITLVGLVLWAMHGMMPIHTLGEWVASLMMAGVLGCVLYLMLFEDFFS